MKLVFVLYKYFPFGGLQRDFLRIALECQKRGHQITVYCRSWQGDIPDGFIVHQIKVKALTNHMANWRFVERFYAAISGKKYDKIIGFNKMPYLDFYYAADDCYREKINQGNWLRRFWHKINPRTRILLRLEESVFKLDAKTQILMISAQQIPVFVRYYGTDAERFFLLPPGIDKKHLKNDDYQHIRINTRKKFNIADDEFIVLQLGSGFRTKGLDRSLLALANLPADLRSKVHFLVVGQDKADKFIRLAKKLNIEQQVSFLGGREDVANLLQAADILIHPARRENTGTVLLEAICSALAVITTAVCGYAAYIKRANCGLIIDNPFKQEQLNNYLQQLLRDKQLRNKLASNGFNYALNADIYNMVYKAADIILNIDNKISYNNIVLKEPFITLFNDDLNNNNAKYNNKIFIEILSKIDNLSGKVYRLLPKRKTIKVSLNQNKTNKINKQNYFIKIHRGIGWYEIIKNLISFKLPVLGAEQEYKAINYLTSLNVPTMQVYGFAKRGYLANQHSFLITGELDNCVDLEQLTLNWQVNKPNFNFKYKLIKCLAKTVRQMHLAGLNHRDCYLCHFLLPQDLLINNQDNYNNLKLYVIDLHRAQIRDELPIRWRDKDLIGLYFSALNIGLTTRDILRFLKFYFNSSIKNIFKTELTLLNKAIIKADKLYFKELLNLGFDNSYYDVTNNKDMLKVVPLDNFDNINYILGNIESYIKDIKLRKSNKVIKDDFGAKLFLVDDYKYLDVPFIIKRYYIKNSLHFLKRFWRESRATVSWRAAHLLIKLGFNTPKPIALLENRKYGLRLGAYYVNEYCKAPDLIAHLKKVDQILEINKLINLMELFIKYKISHGDLKGHNLLWINNNWSLIDLDVMQMHKNNSSFIKAYNKDRQRLLKNFINTDNLELYDYLNKVLPKI